MLLCLAGILGTIASCMCVGQAMVKLRWHEQRERRRLLQMVYGMVHLFRNHVLWRFLLSSFLCKKHRNALVRRY